MTTGKLKTGRRGLQGAIRRAIGAGPNEDVDVVMPEVHRPPGSPSPAAPPGDEAEWNRLRSASRFELRERGLRCWSLFIKTPSGDYEDVEDGSAVATHELWLFPGEWYAAIPRGYEVVNIFGNRRPFVPVLTDSSMRVGCLSYGVMSRL